MHSEIEILFFQIIFMESIYKGIISQIENQNVLVVLTADHECGGLAVHDGDEGNLDIQFTSDYHSANFVPIWASGPGSYFFDAMMYNTMIGKQLIKYIKHR